MRSTQYFSRLFEANTVGKERNPKRDLLLLTPYFFLLHCLPSPRTQREFPPWKPPHFESIFLISRRFFYFLKCLKCGGKTGVNFLRILNIFTEPFLSISVKTTGHRVTKIYTVSCNSINYNFYFLNFFLTHIFLKSFFIYAILSSYV